MKENVRKFFCRGIACCSLLSFLTGCEGPMFEGSPFQRQPPRTNLDMIRAQSAQDQLTADVQQLNGQFAEVTRREEQLEARLTRLETAVRALGQNKPVSYDADITALRRDLQQTRAENAQMRRQITDDLANRIDTIARQHATHPAAPVAVSASAKTSSAAPARGAGYEHKVERGQTLTEIARGYNVSMQAIMKANNIRNPSSIRVGQLLFIPDVK